MSKILGILSIDFDTDKEIDTDKLRKFKFDLDKIVRDTWGNDAV